MRTMFSTMALTGLAAATAIALPAQEPAPAQEPDPAKVFSENCAACHQEDGKGIEGAFPALAGDAFVKGPPWPAIHVVLEGRAGMPTFKDDLTDAQIAAALTHVRTSWGNAEAPVTTAQVASVRQGKAPDPKNTKVISAH